MSEKKRYMAYGALGLLIGCVYLSTGSIRKAKPVRADGHDAASSASAEDVKAAAPPHAPAVATSNQGAEAIDAAEVIDAPIELAEEVVEELRVYREELASTEWPEDPFGASERWKTRVKPVDVPEEELPQVDGVLELSGISYKAGGGFAVINRTVVGPGDSVHGYTVKKIGRDCVELVDARGRLLNLSIDN